MATVGLKPDPDLRRQDLTPQEAQAILDAVAPEVRKELEMMLPDG